MSEYARYVKLGWKRFLWCHSEKYVVKIVLQAHNLSFTDDDCFLYRMLPSSPACLRFGVVGNFESKKSISAFLTL